MRRTAARPTSGQRRSDRRQLAAAQPERPAAEGVGRDVAQKCQRQSFSSEGPRKLYLERGRAPLLAQLIPEALADQAGLSGDRSNAQCSRGKRFRAKIICAKKNFSFFCK